MLREKAFLLVLMVLLLRYEEASLLCFSDALVDSTTLQAVFRGDVV